jgi:hypothetical protein
VVVAVPVPVPVTVVVTELLIHTPSTSASSPLHVNGGKIIGSSIIGRSGDEPLELTTKAAVIIVATVPAAITPPVTAPVATVDELTPPVCSWACRLTDAIDAASAKNTKLFFMIIPYKILHLIDHFTLL